MKIIRPKKIKLGKEWMQRLCMLHGKDKGKVEGLETYEV